VANTVMGAVDPDYAGVVSGTNSALRELGGVAVPAGMRVAAEEAD
jgi:hypothetical protein